MDKMHLEKTRCIWKNKSNPAEVKPYFLTIQSHFKLSAILPSLTGNTPLKYKQFKLLVSKQFKSLISQFSNLWVIEKKK